VLVCGVVSFHNLPIEAYPDVANLGVRSHISAVTPAP
jgi:hypothetical protein